MIATRIRRRLGHYRRHYLTLLYNWAGTWVPSHHVRQAWLRAAGATIGDGSAIFMGTQVLAPERLVLGSECIVGARAVLDARGGLTIGDRTNLANDVQIITGAHDVDDDDFSAYFRPVHIGHHCWITTRSIVLAGCTVGDHAVVAAQSVVARDVAPATVVAGSPARYLRDRKSRTDYNPAYRPRFF